MTNSLSFVNTQWFWPIFLFAALLLAVFIWKELIGSSKKRRLLRIICAFLAVLSLALIILKPSITEKAKTSELAILTSGYQEHVLDSLKKVYKNLKVQNYSQGQNIFNNNEKTTDVFILGHGLETFDLWQLDGLSTNFLSNDSISGITRLNYNQNIIAGTTVSINGQYNNPKFGNKLYLKDPGGTLLDSVRLDSSQYQKFHLKGKSKLSGQLLYSIEEQDSLGEIVSIEPLPLNLSDKNKLSILILNSFPAFETKYLKNYLAELGHEVMVRSQLTKGRFKYEYFNTNSKIRASISAKSLEAFDVLIIDNTSIRNLSMSQLNVLNNSVRNEGLGIFIQSDAGFYNQKNRLISFAFKPENTASFTLAENQKIEISKYNYNFQKEALLEPIHVKDSKIYSAYYITGNGKIASTVAYNTYELILKGSLDVYQQFWTEVLNVIAKVQVQLSDWENVALFTRKDQPFDFKLRTTLNEPKIIGNDNNLIPLRQDIIVQSLWYGKTYPKALGWNNLKLEQDSTVANSYYVINDDNYKSIQAYNTINENKRHFTNTDRIISQFTHIKVISPIWFYILFLISIGFLWLEPKL